MGERVDRGGGAREGQRRGAGSESLAQDGASLTVQGWVRRAQCSSKSV